MAAAWAAAACIFGLVVAPAPAHACTMVGSSCKDPMPDDGNCWFEGAQLIVEDNGRQYTSSEVNLVIRTRGNIIDGDATLTDPQAGQSKGTASGAISGIKIQFVVRWTSGPLTGQQTSYSGTVYADQTAGGTNDYNAGTTINWYTKFNDRIDCSRQSL